MIELYAFIGIIICLVLFLVFLILITPKSTYTNVSMPKKNDGPHMKIYNHFNNASLSIHVLKFNDQKRIIGQKEMANVKNIYNLPLRFFEHGFSNPVIRIYLVPHNNPGQKIHITDVQLNPPPATMFKDLHIGSITTRIGGDTWEQLNSGTNQGLATLSSTFLRIHNTTNKPLSFNNGKIIIPPKDYHRFRGYDDMGVPLGFYLVDDDGFYNTFQYLKPFSDVYFGVTSANEQPINGVFNRYEFSVNYDYAQTLWPFQDGIY